MCSVQIFHLTDLIFLVLEGVVDVIIYSSPDGGESRKNRGFCFVDFVDHKSASDAKRRISMGKVGFG